MGKFSRDKGARIKHGLYKSRIYRIWSGMKYRCSEKDVSHKKDYIDKGVTVCDEWQEFVPFYEWAMKNGYRDDLTIDRIDVTKGYSPDNCRWADMFVQNNNRRDNLFLEFNGRKLTMTQWARELGISKTALNKRLSEYHWDVKKALTTPVRKKRLYEPTICINNGVVIGRFNSASEAARFVGGRPHGVSMCCLGYRKTYKGLQWRYENGSI